MIDISTTADTFENLFTQASQRVRALAMLEHLAEHGPLWKKKLYDDLPLDASVQTVGRNVGQLGDADLVKPVFVDDKKANIGFVLTDEGRAFVENHRVCTLCEDVVDADHSHDYEVETATDYLGGDT